MCRVPICTSTAAMRRRETPRTLGKPSKQATESVSLDGATPAHVPEPSPAAGSAVQRPPADNAITSARPTPPVANAAPKAVTATSPAILAIVRPRLRSGPGTSTWRRDRDATSGMALW